MTEARKQQSLLKTSPCAAEPLGHVDSFRARMTTTALPRGETRDMYTCDSMINRPSGLTSHRTSMLTDSVVRSKVFSQPCTLCIESKPCWDGESGCRLESDMLTGLDACLRHRSLSDFGPCQDWSSPTCGRTVSRFWASSFDFASTEKLRRHFQQMQSDGVEAALGVMLCMLFANTSII